MRHVGNTRQLLFLLKMMLEQLADVALRLEIDIVRNDRGRDLGQSVEVILEKRNLTTTLKYTVYPITNS